MWSAECPGDGVVSAGPPERFGDDVVGCGGDLALRTGAAVVEGGAAASVLEHAAAPLAVAVAPDEERVNDGPEVFTGLGELVEVSAAVVGVGESFEDAAVDEPVQAARQDGLGDVEVGVEVVEAANPVEGVTDDEQRPALADDLEGTGEGAVLAFVILTEHTPTLPGMGSVTGPVWYGDPMSLLTELKGRGVAPWLPVALLLTGVGWGSNQITPMLLVYQRTLSLSTGTVEAMFGVYALGLIPGLLVTGPLSDARGRRVVVIPAAALSLLASVALAAGGHSPWLLFVGRFLAGVSSGAAFGAATAWVRELSRPPYGDVGDHVAARRAALSMTLGFALGPLVAGVLAQWSPDPLLVAYLPHLLLMAVVLTAIGASPETVTTRHRPSLIRRVPTFDRSRFRRVVAPMAPWVFAAPAVAFALLPSVLGAARATDGTAIVAAVTALCALAGVAVQPLARRLDARSEVSRAAPVGLIVLAAGLALSAAAAAVDRLWLLFPCAAVLGAAYGLCLVAGLVQVQRLAPADSLARLTAVFYVITYVGFAAPYVLALAAHLVGYPTLLSATAGLALLTAAAVYLAAGRHAGGQPTAPVGMADADVIPT